MHHSWHQRRQQNALWIVLTFLAAIPALGAELAGRIEATWDVSANGAAQYSIPIRITEGINGLTPRLAVTYSAGERSIFGTGFVLAGLSAISPCRRTIVQDGVAAPVTLSSGDRYCLDGARLRLISGTWGASESVYRAEVDRLARITAKESTANIPGWFLVEMPDGLRYEYGRTGDSQLGIQFWAANKIVDRDGNSIDFVYDMDGGLSRFRPLEIRYTNSSAGAAKYKVLFIYQSSPQPGPTDQITPGSVGGGHHIETHLLDRIELLHENLEYREYRFGYEPGAGTNLRLQWIEECTPANDCLGKTTFSWNSGSSGHAQAVDVSGTASGMPMDVNGDGYEDYVWSESGTWRLKWGSLNGLGGTTNTFIASYGGGRPLDWDGDGRMDLLVPWSDSKFRVLRGTTTGFASEVHAGPGGIPSNTTNSDWHVADVNGDGLDDLLRLRTNLYFELYVRLNGTGGFGAETVAASDPYLISMGWGFLNAIYGTSGVRRPDFNGDGRSDLLLYLCQWDYEFQQCLWWGWHYLQATGTSSYTVQGSIPDATYMQQPRYGDFNHDGLTDVAYAGQSWGMFCFGFGQGGGGLIISCSPTTSGYSLFAMLTGDYDGDGYDDLYVTPADLASWTVIRSTGTGISANGTQIPSGVPYNGGFWHTGDFNGDGLLDLGRSNNGTWSMFAHLGVPADRLASATDGVGNKASFTYLPMTAASIYIKGSGAIPPERDYQTAMQLVQTMTVELAGGTSYWMSFYYKDARIHARGRGFLGMASRTIVDTRSAIVRTETYRQDFPYIGAVAGVTTYQPGGVKIIESVLHEYDKHTLSGTLYNERYLPYRWRSTTTRREVGGMLDNQVITEFIDTRTVNPLGNTLSAEVRIIDRDPGSLEPSYEYKTTVTAAYNEDQGNWCLSIPTSRAETRTLPDLTSRTRTTQWVVNACRVTQETIEPGAGSMLSLVTDLGYDSCGNVASITSYPAGQSGSGRTTTINYGTRCQLPETITNPLGHQSKIEYNWALGLPSAYTDPNEVGETSPKKTQVFYDGFGRESRIVRKDGTATRVTLTKCDSGNGWCGKSDNAIRLQITRTERDFYDVILRTDEEFLDGFGRERFSHMGSLESGPSIIETRYDAFGRPIQRSQPYFIAQPVYWFVWQRDLLGRITLETAPGNRVTTWSYAARTVTTTDPLNVTTARRHSVLDQLLRIEEPNPGGHTNHAYWPFGELKSVKDATGNVTQWNYNARGFVESTSDPDSGSTTFEVNAFGETAKIRDAKTANPNWSTEFTFDKLSRPLTRLEAEGTTNFVWGNVQSEKNIGRLKYVTSPGSYSEYFYFDAYGRLERQTVNADAGTYHLYLNYYAASGLLNEVTYPASTGASPLKIKYEYANNLLKRVKEAGTGPVYWEAVSTNAFGDYHDEVFGNNVKVFRQFSPATGEMTARTGGVGSYSGLINVELAWNAVGNLDYRRDLLLSPNVTEQIYYDGIHRFDRSTLNGTTNEDVTLDAAGNITWKQGVGSFAYTGAQSGCTYGHPHAQPRAVRNAGGTVYCYDPNGNMIRRAGETITYASFNLPTLINAPGGGSSALSYGAFRNRYKQIAQSPGSTETTIYVAGLFEKVTRTGAPTEYRHLIRGGNGVAAIHIRRTSGSSDTYYLHKDHLGSPELITGTGGSVVARLSFAAYGERRDDDHDGAIPPGELGALANVTRRGFTGHEHLDQVGLIHMNGRVYDPRIGRFLGVDPIVVAGHSQGANAYAYVWNNPLTYTDPSGFCPEVTGPCPPPAYGPVYFDLPGEWQADMGLSRSKIWWAIPPAPPYESPAMQVPSEGRATFGPRHAGVPNILATSRTIARRHGAFGSFHASLISLSANLSADMADPEQVEQINRFLKQPDPPLTEAVLRAIWLLRALHAADRHKRLTEIKAALESIHGERSALLAEYYSEGGRTSYASEWNGITPRNALEGSIDNLDRNIAVVEDAISDANRACGGECEAIGDDGLGYLDIVINPIDMPTSNDYFTGRISVPKRKP